MTQLRADAAYRWSRRAVPVGNGATAGTATLHDLRCRRHTETGSKGARQSIRNRRKLRWTVPLRYAEAQLSLVSVSDR
jgi:hypothetical protein